MAEGDSAPNLHAQWKTPVKPVITVADVHPACLLLRPLPVAWAGCGVQDPRPLLARRALPLAVTVAAVPPMAPRPDGGPRSRARLPGMSAPRRATGTIAALGVRGRPGPPAGADAGTMPGDVPPI